MPHAMTSQADLQTALVRAQLALAVCGIMATGDARPALRSRRAGEAYSGDRVAFGELAEIGDGAVVRFDLRAAGRFDFIELEVPAIPGTYRLDALHLQGTQVRDLQARVIHVRDQLLPASVKGQVRFSSELHRPRLELDVRGLFGEATAEPVIAWIEVAIHREDPAATIVATIENRIDRLSMEFERHAREVGETSLSHGEELRRLFELQGATEKQLARMAETGRGHDDALEHLRQRFDTLSEDIERRAGMQQQRFDTLSEDIARHAGMQQRIFETLDAQGHQSAATRSHAEQIQKELHSELQQELRQIRHVIENVFWRRWLRRLRGVRS